MCPNCNAPVQPDSDFCTTCGTRVRPAGGPPVSEPVTPAQPAASYGQAAPPGLVVPPAPAGPQHPAGQAASHPFKFDLNHLAAADKTIGVASIIVFISLFLPWYGALGATVSGMSLHGYLTIALLAAVALVGYLVLRAGWDTPPIRLPIAHAPLLLVGTGLQLLIVFIAFLQADGLGHEVGAYLALLSALVACGVIAVPVVRSVLDAQSGGTR